MTNLTALSEIAMIARRLGDPNKSAPTPTERAEWSVRILELVTLLANEGARK